MSVLMTWSGNTKSNKSFDQNLKSFNRNQKKFNQTLKNLQSKPENLQSKPTQVMIEAALGVDNAFNLCVSPGRGPTLCSSRWPDALRASNGAARRSPRLARC